MGFLCFLVFFWFSGFSNSLNVSFCISLVHVRLSVYKLVCEFVCINDCIGPCKSVRAQKCKKTGTRYSSRVERRSSKESKNYTESLESSKRLKKAKR